MRTNAFTLVELLIVVLLVLILIAIATPSLQEAHTTSQINSARSRMMAMETALQFHLQDWGSVPADFNDSLNVTIAYRMRSLASPVCSRFADLSFATDGGLEFNIVGRGSFYAENVHCPLTSPVLYLPVSDTIDPFSDGTVPFGYDSREIISVIEYGAFFSAGPDRIAGDWVRGFHGPQGLPYSPTNGITSRGELWGVVSSCEPKPFPAPTCVADAEYLTRRHFPQEEQTDINHDGIVNAFDLNLLITDWQKVSAP